MKFAIVNIKIMGDDKEDFITIGRRLADIIAYSSGDEIQINSPLVPGDGLILGTIEKVIHLDNCTIYITTSKAKRSEQPSLRNGAGAPVRFDTHESIGSRNWRVIAGSTLDNQLKLLLKLDIEETIKHMLLNTAPNNGTPFSLCFKPIHPYNRRRDFPDVIIGTTQEYLATLGHEIHNEYSSSILSLVVSIVFAPSERMDAAQMVVNVEFELK